LLKDKEVVMKWQSSGMTLFFLTFLLVLASVSVSWSGEIVDHSLYGELLGKYVRGGVVDYQGFKNEEKRLDQYLRKLEGTNPDALPRKEQFALYINAYNAYTVKLILENYPVKSIKSTVTWPKSPWKKRFCRIGGKTLTLDQIEHDILRPRFKDPRVHFAINCAAKSCPPLISEPYQGNILDQQLDSSTRTFLNNPERNHLEGNILSVSKIFKWFKDDFQGDVVGFFLKYAREDLRSHLLAKKDQIKIEYLHYDWGLNGK
jgi:hypothetical protein